MRPTCSPVPYPTISVVSNNIPEYVYMSIIYFFCLVGLVLLCKLRAERCSVSPVIAIEIPIPIAVSISIQTVDNDHIGSVL